MPIILGGTTNTILTTTWANKPASYPVGQSVFMSNVGPKGSHWWFDGTRWKPTNGSLILASHDTVSSSIGNTATIVFQYQMPAGLWQTGDYLSIHQSSMEKSGATDSGVLTIRIGTAGTTADTSVGSGTVMSTSSRVYRGFTDFRLESATSVQQVSSTPGYGNSNSALSPVTISSATANALYINVIINSSGTTDTVALRGGYIQLIAKAN